MEQVVALNMEQAVALNMEFLMAVIYAALGKIGKVHVDQLPSLYQ